MAIAFQYLQSGADYFACAEEYFHPASTFKVAVMMEIFHQARAGLLSHDDAVTVINSFKRRGWQPHCDSRRGRCRYYPVQHIGRTTPLRELVRLMIVRSSNLATNLVIQIAGAKRVNAYVQELGIQGVRVLRGPEDNSALALGLNNTATARGLMQMMTALAGAEVASLAASEEMVQILLGQEFNEGIPARLPAGIRVAHNTGWNADLYHDFGIIFPASRGPYVLAVMTSGFEIEQDAHTCVAEISASPYESLTGPSG